MFLSLVSYDPLDPTFNQAVTKGMRVHNTAGKLGAYTAGVLADLFGVCAFFVPLWLGYFGLGRFFTFARLPGYRLTGCWLLFFAALTLCATDWGKEVFSFGQIAGGGYFGREFTRIGTDFLSDVGAFLLWLMICLAGAQLLAGVTWDALGKRVAGLAKDFWLKHRERIIKRIKKIEFFRLSEEPRPGPPPEAVDGLLERITGPTPAVSPASSDDPAPDLVVRSVPKTQKTAAKPSAWPHAPRLPQVSMLTPAPITKTAVSEEALREKAAKLVACLEDFGIEGELRQIVPGPVVTMFEYKPAPGIKISRISGLSDDLALALRAMAVRIEAPIPGKDTVGVEIPNDTRETVYLREIMESEAFAASESPLTIVIGKDIQGRPQVADLAKMPHLLVAGATGAGKSVGLNDFLLSFLFKATPDMVKLLLIDPKRIELSTYAGLPHLVHPVVTDTVMAKTALEWAVHEMDKRYEAMERLAVRNIAGYNEKLAKLDPDQAEQFAALEPMPYLVIVIDELADLMMTASKEVELCIVRLAQLARAAGIHMILATQRPSVDVVTGLIKANFPTRVAFQVTSKHDSRTILDTGGAEKLLGRGDMLFKPSGGRMVRMHAAYVTDEDISRVVDFWKSQAKPEFELDFSQWKKDEGPAGLDTGNGGGDDAGDIASDPVYDQALEFVLEQGKASISLIQRRFRIGFNRAARYIEQMERDGILGSADGAKPRSVIRRD